MPVEIIRELDNFRGEAVLVRKGDDYFAVSTLDFEALMSSPPYLRRMPTPPPETLVFPADADGRVTSWVKVAGGRNMSREAAIADLEASYPPEVDSTGYDAS